MRALLLLLVLATPVAGCASGGARDVVPPTRDVQISGAQPQGSYVYVARRAYGFVGLSSQEGLGMESAQGAVGRLADEMDACATRLAQQKKLVDGAVRLTVLVRPDGTVAPSQITVAPGDAVAANALLCVMSPLRMLTFAPSTDSTGRAFAIDATWGPGAS